VSPRRCSPNSVAAAGKRGVAVLVEAVNQTFDGVERGGDDGSTGSFGF